MSSVWGTTKMLIIHEVRRRGTSTSLPASEGSRNPPRLNTAAGFTITELIVWIGVAVSVMTAATASYIGTTRSWDGTADLARIQRDGSIAVEAMARGVRRGSSVTVGGGGDSLNVFYYTGSYDSLVACFYLDGQGCIRNISGAEVAADVDSIVFGTPDGATVNMDLYLRDDRGTLNHAGDDLPVVVSSSVACRN